MFIDGDVMKTESMPGKELRRQTLAGWWGKPRNVWGYQKLKDARRMFLLQVLQGYGLAATLILDF